MYMYSHYSANVLDKFIRRVCYKAFLKSNLLFKTMKLWPNSTLNYSLSIDSMYHLLILLSIWL